jgi:hypothetical protein
LAIVNTRPYIISVLTPALVAALSGAAPTQSRDVEQISPGTRRGAELVESFDGLGAGLSASPTVRNPSDNSLAVGPDHIMQTVNSQIAVLTKKGQRYDTTGRLLYGPIATNTVFAGFGGVCEARPNGDAVVRYDQLAGRWLIVMPIFRRTMFSPESRLVNVREPAAPGEAARPGQAAQPGAAARFGPPPTPPPPGPRGQGGSAAGQPPDGSYAMCYAVSVGGDPLGAYYRYVFERP